MQDRVLRTALAGLLHEIGTFARRAGWPHGAHAGEGSAFAHQYVPVQWRDALDALWVQPGHAPQESAAKVVALADRLSAGAPHGADGGQPRCLRSIFDRIQIEHAHHAERYLTPGPLAVADEALFAREDPAAGMGYEALWAGFVQDAAALRDAHEGQQGDLATYLSSMCMLLERHAWAVSSAHEALPDVSLYDHSRITAALAACLLDVPEAQLDALLAPGGGQDGETPLALLVGGDISGVQDFIYTLSSRGATSALRGRSFYLQLLTEAAMCYVLRQLELPGTNVIYGGGGHFFLLAPPDAAGALDEIRRRVSEVLLHHHGGDLYLALAHVPLRAGDLHGQALGARWTVLAHALRQAKGRRFSELGDDMHRLLFMPWRDQGNQERECAVCHREHPGTDENDEGTRKCPLCLAFEQLGQDLRQAAILRLDEVPERPLAEDAPPAKWYEVLAALGLAAGIGPAGVLPGPASGARRGRALALDDEALEALHPGPRLAVGRRLLVNVTPIHKGRVKTFEQMAADARGIDRLGVLRMDVDDMGLLFSRGLGDAATLSRQAALSMAVSAFFEGWVGVLAARHNSGDQSASDRVYSIYSGGDDLFIVGSWDAIPHLALEIRNEFARYTGHHPDLHLCAGIALIGGRYPLYQAAGDAGQAERMAKALPGKDAITFLGQTCRWETFGRVAEWAAEMRHMCEDEHVPRSLPHTLVALQRQHDAEGERRARAGQDRTQAGEGQTYYGPWIPRAAYILYRAKKRHKGACASIEKLEKALRGDDFAAIRWIGLAARWAELELRKRRVTT